MSSTFHFHPRVEAEPCLRYLVGRGYRLHREENGGAGSLVSLREALALEVVLLKGPPEAPSWLWADLDQIDETICLFSLTRYAGNRASPTLNAILDHTGGEVYIVEEGDLFDGSEWTTASVACHPNGSEIRFWRTTPTLIFPGERPAKASCNGCGCPGRDPALDRYLAERKAWLLPRLRRQDYLVADLESRRASQPTDEEWFVIQDLEFSGVEVRCFHKFLYLPESMSVVPFGGRPFDWQRDEHGRLIDRMWGREGEKGAASSSNPVDSSG